MTTFTIPGAPFAKQRPRFSRRSGRAFTPKETVSFENLVQQIALQHFAAPIEGPVKMTVLATFQPPQSWSKKKTAAHMCRPHTQRPDIDNLAKALQDALNRIAYADDSQISEITASKMWGPIAQTVVTVEAAAHG